jgi:hypothetical protein
MSDETHFCGSDCVNKQNCRYWAPNNTHELHQRPPLSVKWQCCVKFTLMALLDLISLECEGACSKCKSRAVQSHAGNISAHWVTSSSARFAVFPTVWNNCSHSRNFHANLQENISGQTHFSFRGNYLALSLAWPCNNRLLPLGLRYKQSIRNMSCQYCWLKTANSGVYSRDSQGNVTTCCDSLSIATAGVCWTSWWSIRKCHIQTVMTEMDFHGHGMRPIMLINTLL